MFIVSFVFLIFASALSYGKGAILITGYNTMTDKKRAQYDEESLCKSMDKIVNGSMGGLFLMGLSELIKNQLLFILGTA